MAIATAWSLGFPALISVLILDEITLDDLPDLSGIFISRKKPAVRLANREILTRECVIEYIS